MKLYALLAVAVASPIPQKKVPTPKLTICRESFLKCADSDELCISNYKKCQKQSFGGKLKTATECSSDRDRCEAENNKSKECQNAKVRGACEFEFSGQCSKEVVIAENEFYIKQRRKCMEFLSFCSEEEKRCLRESK